MRLIVFDLIPALLSWEGRDDSGPPVVARDAMGVFHELFGKFRMAGIADSTHTRGELRRFLDTEGLAVFFESIGTAADFGPDVSPRVIRRVAATVGATPDRVILVTGRTELADAVHGARMAVVVTEDLDGFAGVPEAIQRVTGRFSP